MAEHGAEVELDLNNGKYGGGDESGDEEKGDDESRDLRIGSATVSVNAPWALMASLNRAW